MEKTKAKVKVQAKPRAKKPSKPAGIAPIWSPSAQAIESAQMTHFQRHIVRKYHLEKGDYPDFYQWTVDHPEEFWSELWDFCGVIASKKGSTVLVDGDSQALLNVCLRDVVECCGRLIQKQNARLVNDRAGN